MKISLIETQKNIRTVNKACKELSDTITEYNAEVERINGRRNIFAEGVINRELEEARGKYSEKMKKLATQGIEAVNSLWDNQEIKSQKLDLSDSKLTTTISLIQQIGKNLEYNEVCDMVDGFKGNIPALKLIGKTLASNGNEYAAKYCNELCRTPNEFNYEEISRAFGAVVYGSDPLRSWHSPVYYLPRINDMAKRFGIDEGENPYLEELRALCAASGGDETARKALAEGLRIAEEKPEETTETDSQLAYIINTAKSKIDEQAEAHKFCVEHMTEPIQNKINNM